MAMICRVCNYIKYGWDIYLVDPDGGANVQNKLQVAQLNKNPEDVTLLRTIPDIKDSLWTKEIYKAPSVTFGTIYQFLVERKVLIKKANHLESVIDRRDGSDLGVHVQGNVNLSPGTSETVSYTRTLDKAYRFFQDGHVQKVRYHPMPSLPEYVCIGASVLPSMKKNKMYNVRVVLSNNTAHVCKAICDCPAGLSGCCNHITATLYCVQEYFHLKINEEDEKSCTEKRQSWNVSKKKKVDARPTKLVTLTKKVYGVEKRPKLCRVNQWDCRPTSRRTAHPERRTSLVNRLSQIHQMKTEAASHAVSSAVSDGDKKKASKTQSMLFSYGTSCFLQLLDEETAPSENRLDQIRKERIARAEAKKLQFQLSLLCLTKIVNHDHDYCTTTSLIQRKIDGVPAPHHLVRNLYEEHVCISPTEATDLEIKTRTQAQSSLWHEERKFRITASIMKTVCHRKPKTDMIPFINSKLAPKPITTPAIDYGKRNEDVAIGCYIDHQRKKGVIVKVCKCGLWIDSAIPWLAATPDSILEVGEDRGCLEVKCPYVCANMSLAQASMKSSSFCLQNGNGTLQLKRNHQYFYQIQVQLHVTRLLWCDFVVWTPNEIYIEKIDYDQRFIEKAISKARTFYFTVFLPAIVPYVLILMITCRF